jgi:hypothetical protein
LNVTVTDATGCGAGDATETDALALAPDDVAVIVALPGLTAVATPTADTETIVGLELLHVMAGF